MTIQLEPVQMPGARGLDETEEERRAREAAEAAAAQVSAQIEPIVPPPAVPPPELGPNPAAPPGAAEAQAVGDRYRANADRGLAATERTHPVRDRATSRTMPDAHILRFDDPSQPAAAASPPTSQPRRAAPSAGRQLGSPVDPYPEETAAVGGTWVEDRNGGHYVPPAGESASESRPLAPRDRLRARLEAKHGAGKAASAPQRQPVDHTGADVADAFRRPLHGLAAGLMRAAGMRPGEFRSMGDQSRQRERQSIEQDTAQRQQASRQRLAEMREQRAGATLESQQADRVARREDAAARTQSLADYRQQMARIRQAVADGQISRSQAAAGAIQLRTQHEQEQRDPNSEASASARNAYTQWRNGLPERLRSSLGMSDVSEMTAEQIQRMEAEHVRAIGTRRDVGRRRSGGGGGSAAAQGVPRGQWGTNADPLLQEMLQSGVPRAAAEATARNSAERARVARSMATSAVTAGRRDEDQVNSDVQRLGRSLDDGRAFRRSTTRAAEMVANASNAQLRAAFLDGLAADAMPPDVQRIASAVNAMQAQLLMDRSGSAVSEQEFDRTRRELGSMPTRDPSVIRQWVARAATEAGTMESRIRARFDDPVVEAYRRRLAREGIGGSGGERSQQGQRQQAPAANRVRVRLPNGTTGTVPRASVSRLPEGTEVLDG